MKSAIDMRVRSDVSREQILTAARGHFERFGYCEANIPGVARSVGLVLGTVYARSGR